LFGFDVSEWTAASFALILFSSAFLFEIWRGCIESIPKGQWEASRCLGLSYYEIMRHIILPQALRVSIPPTVGFSVQIVKGTALASIIGFVELTKAGSMVALIYFLLCYPLSVASRKLENKLNVAR
jgi:polar amino acid transport system permease protein